MTDANLLLGYLGDGAELGGELTLSAEAAETRADGPRRRARPRSARDRARCRARGQRRDGPGAAGDHRRARARPARVRARRLRRRGRAARLRARRGARDPDRARAARRRRAERARARDRATSAATTCARCSAASDADRTPSRRWRSRPARTCDEPELRRRADLRYRGQSFELTVEADDLGARRGALRRGARAPLRLPDGGRGRRARQRSAWSPRCRSSGRSWSPRRPSGDAEAGRAPRATSTATGARCPSTAARAWAQGFEVEGPAIVEFAEATCVVRPGLVGRDRRDRHAGAGAR